MRIVDLSVALKAGIASDPPNMLPSIEYRDHKEGGRLELGRAVFIHPQTIRRDRRCQTDLGRA